MGRFDDRASKPERTPRDMLRWEHERLTGLVPADPDPEFRPGVRENDGRALHELDASLTWIGHTTFLARLGGAWLLTDPIWSKRLSRVLPRLVPPGLELSALPALDLVLLSHNHRDHFDRPTVRRLGAGPLYVAPLGNGKLLRRAGAREVVELDWWQSYRHGELEVTLVPSRHWSMQAPWDRNEALWGGFVVRAPEGTLYFAGDTAFFDGFEEIGRRLGPIDWAILPIGAYSPRWFMAPQHVEPEEAGEAADLLGAPVFVPSHWGTFKLSDEPLCEPPQRIRAWWAAHGKDPRNLWLLDVGETRALEKVKR